MIRQKTTIIDGKLHTQLVHTNYKISRPLGRCKNRPTFEPQQLTNRKFMSASQKRAFDAGEEIWV